MVGQVADKFLACGILEHGFARIRCDAYAHEYLLGDIARVAAGTVTAAIRTLTGERELAVGIVACLQTHGSRAKWHPHLHLRVTDGGFRPDGTFVAWPAHDTARVTEAFRRAVLRLFVRVALFDEDQAAGMLTWPHSGFHGYTAVWVPEDDRAFATRLARGPPRRRAATFGGDVRRARWSHRGVVSAPADTRPPVLARRETTPYTRPTPIEFPIRPARYGILERPS